MPKIVFIVTRKTFNICKYQPPYLILADNFDNLCHI